MMISELGPTSPTYASVSPRRRIFIIHGSHHLTDHAFSGDGLVAWGFISELARRGHEIHVATDRLDVLAPSPPNLTLVEFSRIHRNSALHYLWYMRQVRKYYDRLAATSGVDVVHQMNPVVRGLSLALLGRDVPIVLGTYVGDWVRLRTSSHQPKQGIAKRLKRALKAVVDAVQQQFASSLILATPHALDRVPLRGTLWKRITFMHHGVDTTLYNPAPVPTDPERSDKRILFVGRLDKHKGIFTLVDAFARVIQRVPDANLVFVGHGYHAEVLKASVGDLGIEGSVLFTGRATRAEVAGWMRSCDVLCAPSEGEPYGQNVLEAMATGKPVIITNQGGHRHIGDPDGTVRVDPENVEQLAAALLLLLQDPEQSAEMGRHNRVVAEQTHAWPRVTDQLEQIYERAISLKKTRRSRFGTRGNAFPRSSSVQWK
jgi:glycosyltransferase involved in cell wall biosynthesis